MKPNTCNVCGKLSEKPQRKHECATEDIVAQCKKYREMLVDVCDDATISDELNEQESFIESQSLLSVSVLVRARVLIGWEDL